LKKEESVLTANSRIVCSAILTYVHNYAHIVALQYL